MKLGPALPPPVNLEVTQRRTLCKICFGPCDDAITLVCDICHDRASTAPAPAAAGVAAFGNKMGTSAFRPPKARRGPSAGARAFRAAAWGAVLVAAGFGVVHVIRPPEPGASLSRDAKSAAAAVDFAMPKDSVVHFRTTLDVQVMREEVPSTFDTAMMTIFDLRQVATHDAEVMMLRGDADSAVLEVRTACRLVRQTGVWEQKDGSLRPIYPWPDRIEVDRVRAHAEGAMERVSGGEPLPARDVPPLLVFGHTGAPRGELSAGVRWSTEALLPCLVTRSGAIAPSPFDCRFKYVGTRVLQGRKCVIVRLDAAPLRRLDESFEHLDGVGGKVAGSLAYDTSSGLLMQADLEIDAYATHGGSSPDERARMKGSLLVTRR